MLSAQEPTPEPAVVATPKPVDFKTNALKQLGLSRDQLQRIRALNQERKPLMDAAQMRLRMANRSLDGTIYSDTATETDFQARLKDFQMAQAEVAKIRFMNEFGVRRILTAEQLTRFRQLRDRFEDSRAITKRDVPAGPLTTREPQRPLRQLIKQNFRRK